MAAWNWKFTANIYLKLFTNLLAEKRTA